MQTRVLPPVRISIKLDEDLDALVKDGFYGSKSEAVRDAVRTMIREQRGILKRYYPNETRSSVEITREARKELWNKITRDVKNEKEAMKKFVDYFTK